MRLLTVRANHESSGTAKRQAKAHRQGYRPSDVRQHLSLRNFPTHPARYSSRRGNFRGGRALVPEGGAMTTALLQKRKSVGRREFLKTSAAVTSGLCIAAYVPELGAGARELAAAGPGIFAPNAFLRIRPDDTVTVIVNHSEMGQGVYISLPMLLNEKLEADWSRIKVESAPLDASYNHPIYVVQVAGACITTRSALDP